MAFKKGNLKRILSCTLLVAASAYFFTTVWMTMRLDQYANSYVNGWVDLPGPKMILNQTERSITTKASSNLPYFVLHVGPQKTMSSAIQCSLLKLKPFLAQDDYVFIGKVDARACGKNGIPIDPALIAPFSKRACVNEMLEAVRTAATKDDENSGLQSVQCWTDFTKALSDLNSTNIILSEEKLSETHLFGFPDMTESLWKILQDQLKDKFQFQLCVVYRRYYEWLASVKNQGDKYSLGRRGIKAWDGPVKEPIFPHLMRWMLNTSEIPSPYTPEVYRVYHDQLQLPVDLLNMHDGTDLLENFLCQVLRGATHTCQAYLSNRSDYQYHSNPSENPFYDMIAYDAFHQGLIRDLRGWRKGADRLYITEMIGRRQQRFRKTPMDLPLICPSRTDVLPLLTKTLDYERAFLPQFFDTDAGSPSLEREFWTQIAKRKFCSVNTTAVLEKPEYRYWLYNIWDPRRGKKPVDWTTSNYTISNANFSKKEGIIIRK